MLLLFLADQAAPASPANINLSQAAADLWAQLNANGPADAVYWTLDDIFLYFNQAAKQLAIRGGVFTSYDTTVVLADATSGYDLPALQINTIQADVAGAVLKARNLQEIEALDDDWPTTAGTPDSFLQDTQGSRQVTVYPTPTGASDGATLGLTIEGYLMDVDASGAIIAAPECLEEYFHFFALAEARSTKETRSQMPEITQWCRGIVDLLDGVISSYWGDKPGT